MDQVPEADAARDDDAGDKLSTRSLGLYFATQRDTDFVRKAPRRFFVGLYWAAVGLFATWGYWSYAPDPGVPGPPWPLAICLPLAKMFGRVLTLTLCLLLLTAMRTAARRLRSLPSLRHFLPLDALIPDFHRTLAFTLFGAALGHAIFHSVDYALLAGTEFLPWTGGFCVNFSGERTSICLLYTGVAAFSLLAVIVAISVAYLIKTKRWTATPAPRPTEAPRRRDNFATVHLLFSVGAHWVLVPLFVLTVSIHAQSKGYSYVALPIWALAIATVIDVRLRYRGTRVKILHKPRPGQTQNAAIPVALEGGEALYTERFGNVLRLVVEKPPNWTFKAGQSALLHVDFGQVRSTASRGPFLYQLQYHPFTIACSPNTAEATGTLTFLIRAMDNEGSWTGALMEAVDELESIVVAGPNGAPYEYYDGFESAILVGTGAGVTPLAAIFGSMVAEETNSAGLSNGTKDAFMVPSETTGLLEGPMPTAWPRYSNINDEGDRARWFAPTGAQGDGSPDLSADSHSDSSDTDRSSRFNLRLEVSDPLVSWLVSPRVLIYACLLELVATLAIGVYVILDKASLVYDWLMIITQLLMLVVALVPLFTVRLYLLTKHSRPEPAEWVLEIALLLLTLSGVGLAVWGTVSLASNGSGAENRIYWLVWLLFSIQGALTMLLILIRSLVLILYRAPFASDRVNGRRIVFENRTVHFLAFIDRAMQAGLQSVMEPQTDTLRACRVAASRFEVTFCGSATFQPLAADSSLAQYVRTSAKTDTETTTGDYAPRFRDILHRRLQEAHRRRHQRLNFVGVFFCGSPQLSASLYTAVQQAEAEHTAAYGCNCYISFHEERFY